MKLSRLNRASTVVGRCLRFRMRTGLGAAVAATVFLSGTAETQNAIANGDTRTLTIYHTHTQESATITFKRSGSYDREALKQLNWLLRDWRRDEPTNMDPRLFDIVWEVYREVGSREAINIVSAYRAPETNAMLRRRSRAVAEHSQHMLGKAMDFFLPDVTMDKVRAVGMRLQRGGVGYYPTSYNPFVHLDVGSVRSWPRMTHDQLARLFPDGKTVHLPSSGGAMPGYELARAEILARGGAVAGYASSYAAAEESTPQKSFWARLFGGSDEDEDRQQVAPQPVPQRASRVARAPAQQAPTQTAALAPSTGDDVGTRTSFGSRRAGQPSLAALAALEKQVPAASLNAAEPEAAAAPKPEKEPAQAKETMPATAPLPAARPSFAAPETQVALAEQPGAPAGGDADATTSALDKAGVAPLPPRRPGDIAAPVAAPVILASAPLPPARPLDIKSLVPVQASVASASASAALAALAGAAATEAPPITLAYAAPIAPQAAPMPPNRPSPAKSVSVEPPAQAAPQAPAAQTAAPPAQKPVPAAVATALKDRIAAVHALNPSFASENARETLAMALSGTAAAKVLPGHAAAALLPPQATASLAKLPAKPKAAAPTNAPAIVPARASDYGIVDTPFLQNAAPSPHGFSGGSLAVNGGNSVGFR